MESGPSQQPQQNTDKSGILPVFFEMCYTTLSYPNEQFYFPSEKGQVLTLGCLLKPKKALMGTDTSPTPDDGIKNHPTQTMAA